MLVKRRRSSGERNALPRAMRLPFLIFLVSGAATMQLEPIATRGIHTMFETDRLTEIRSRLSYVQMDLMKVLETDAEVTSRLRNEQEYLQYTLRAEQIRRDETAQRRNQKLPPVQGPRCVAAETPRS